jgi:uncharacterized protein (TIGR02284 family)
MNRSDQQSIHVLTKLLRLCHDSESGFNIAAQSISNRGLKALLKTYAQQRASFIRELEEASRELGGEPVAKGTSLANIHRGWIVIKAAMTIGYPNTENVILSEVRRGEEYALNTYRSALAEDLPDHLRAIIERQADIIRTVYTQVKRMHGIRGKQVLIRLYDHEEDLNDVKERLERTGIEPDAMHTVALDEVAQPYGAFYEASHKELTADTIGAGALIGAVLGLFLGFMASIGIVFIPEMLMGFILGVPGTLLLSIIGGGVIGAGFGALFGNFIGRGIGQEDTYLYAESVPQGKVLLLVETDIERAQPIFQIMRQADVESAIT